MAKTVLILGAGFGGLELSTTLSEQLGDEVEVTVITGAPSETFQSDWRCVPGSSFFKPYECNAGDLEAK
jgi:NADH dehydrogenase FAD-containing subunit